MAVSVEELARRTSAVVEEVTRSRRQTIITDHGEPVAAIVPLGEQGSALNDMAEQLAHRARFADLRPEGRSVVDELIIERRAEAAREAAD